MEQEEVSKSSDLNVIHQKISRKGSFITWAIEHFPHWYVEQSCDLSSGVFGTLDGTQWRLVLRKTLEPVLVRDCPTGPDRVRVGFQFSLLTDSDSAVPVSEPLRRTFKDKTEVGCGCSIDVFSERDAFLPENTLTLQCHLWRERSNRPLVRCSTVNLQLGKHSSLVEHWITVFRRTSNSSNVTGSPSLCEEVPPPTQTRACLNIKPHTFQEDYNPNEMLRISLEHDCATPTMTRNRMSVIDDGQPILSSPLSLHLFTSKDESWSIPWQVQRSMITDSMIKDNRSIRIQYEATFANQRLQSSQHSAKRSYCGLRKVRSTLSDDMKRLLSSPDGCHGDMRVVSGDGVSMSAHRVILCARSLVFEAMMERDMTERQSGTVRIPDMGGTALKQLLSFLYTGRLEEEDSLDCDTLAELYNAGDKYGLIALKKRCSVLLRVTTENACDVLEFSDLHSDCAMRDTALSMLCSRTADILISEEWRSLQERKRRLAEQVLAEIRRKRMTRR